MKLLQLFLLTTLLASSTAIVGMAHRPKTAEQKALDTHLSKEKRRQRDLCGRQGLRLVKDGAIDQADANRKEEAAKATSRRTSTSKAHRKTVAATTLPKHNCNPAAAAAATVTTP
jgi:hypothetical protein